MLNEHLAAMDFARFWSDRGDSQVQLVDDFRKLLSFQSHITGEATKIRNF